jgi:spore germination cell wall hydrolase CwlJ-like protein
MTDYEWSSLDGLSLLQCLIFGEAEGEPVEGKIAVANVVRNRVLSPVTWWGETWKTVCLSPYQFSCFGERDDAIEEAYSDWHANKIMRECRWVAAGIINGDIQDNTFGATNYHAIYVEPEWAKSLKLTARICRHLFYK